MNDLKFLQQFMTGLVRAAATNVTDNEDDVRFPKSAAEIRRRRWKEKLLTLGATLGWHRQRFNPRHVENGLAELQPHIEGFSRSFSRWDDDASRALMLELLRYRVLGSGHVKLSSNTPAYWQARERVQHEYLRQPNAAHVGSYVLDEYELPGKGGTIRSVQRPIGAATTFLVEQYALRRPGAEVVAAPGDVVLDCGGCWGDTALYFADRVGPGGRVFSFEFDPANIAIFNRNLAANPRLAPNIERIEHPLWSRSGETMRFTSAGPGTVLGQNASGERETVTLSIDDFVRQRNLERVDFIKMDIEGAEIPALAGARETLQRFRPKLAICAYHKIDDFITIPDFIEQLGGGYRQWLAHFTVHLEETVIFAAP